MALIGSSKKVLILFIHLLSFAILHSFESVAGDLLVEDRNPYLNKVTLDPDGKYLLEWLVDWKEERIVFSVTVKTRGYVGFGLSRGGKMSGADIVIGGVQNGKPYFNDRHAIGHQLPIEDPSQDWIPHSAWENATHTFLSFSRPFETCDVDHDLPINDDSVAIIWAYGEKDDDFEYHGKNRGSHLTYLLDPDLTPRDVRLNERSNDAISPGSGVKIWTISESLIIPAKETTYTCSIHPSPYKKKTHIIGFNTILPTEVERRHIHHYVLYHCNVPTYLDPRKVFEPVKGSIETCYMLDNPTGQIATNFCQEIYYVVGRNQPPFFLPEYGGIPINENGAADYFMLQMHFDNPDEIPNMRASYALELFTVDKLREHDVGTLNFGQSFPASPGILIPPKSPHHTTFGHCGSSCSKIFFPKEGIKPIAVNLHTHYTGRRVRVRHIRNDKELPYLMNDDNFFPTYQKSRILREERILLPGDQIINSCTYDNTETDGVTIGGFSSRQEMCVGVIFYYNKVPNRSFCGSEIRSDAYRNFLNIYNTTWSNEELEMIVTSPEENEGFIVSEMGNRRINWTEKKRRKLQKLHRYLPQITTCPPNVMPSFPRSQRIMRVADSSSEETFQDVVTKSNPTFKDHLKEIIYPEFEFVSVYGKNVIPYRKRSSRVCNKNHNPL